MSSIGVELVSSIMFARPTTFTAPTARSGMRSAAPSCHDSPKMVRPRKKASSSAALPWVALAITIVWFLSWFFDFGRYGIYVAATVGAVFWILVFNVYKP